MAKPGQDLGGSLRYRVERRDGITWVALSGNVTEAADFTPLKALSGPLRVDLSSIERINSLGVRSWILFVIDREAAGVEVTFERCAPVMVQQMRMIRNFMGRRPRVTSVLVPYLCESCKHETLQLVELLAGFEIEARIPCSKCGKAMDLDELLDTYAGLEATGVYDQIP